LHTLHHLSWFLFGFYPYEVLELLFISMTSSSSSKTDFAVAFLVLEVLPICLWRDVKPFIIWFYHPLLDYDFYMHGFV
jgi:hypothetical protein